MLMMKICASPGLHTRSKTAAGFVLLEGLIAILIFSFGVLAIMGLQISSISGVRDAKFRSDAGLYASQIIGAMWADRNNLSAYSLNATGATCAAGTSTSATANVTNWLNDVQGGLPGSAAYKQQIVIGSNNVVTVTVCWKSPQDTGPHNFSATAQIQG
ncbi:type IV pilus modification protein PilV [Collimonas humicola]|uniref:type IV pilus modification protein PilV n=1 Tax=Collimonas humicola TaxID=2825886 RepID=UPI001B8BFE98|nr:type IV pilus modification protein PilV [Collimonas humicola]